MQIARPSQEILVVEDEPITGSYLRQQIERLGYRVSDVAASGEEAIGCLERHCCDMVLMDLKLAGALSGAETAKIVRERFKLPVIYLTAYHDKATLSDIDGAGEYGFLTKPLRIPDLRVALQLAAARSDRQNCLTKAEVEKWEEVCRKAQEQLEDFTYAAGHDLQEPLRTARAFIDLLERRISGKLDADEQKILKQATAGLTRMSTLLNELLEYAQAGLSKGAPIPSIPATAALASAIDNLGSAIAESDAQITYDSLPIVNADPIQLARVFQNLLGNAMKFRRNNVRSRIHVAVEGEMSRWIFRVRDNGIGFEQEYADRIFAPFSRLHSAAIYAGTGIGLAVCRKIIEAHGGEIWAESSAGDGAVFSFTLPRGSCREMKSGADVKRRSR